MKFDPVSYAMGAQTAGSGGDLSDATATRADILYPKTAYLANGRKNVGTMQSLEAATITPSTTNQIIASGKYLAGNQTILGDSNLTSANIKKHITIFGVTGSYEGETETSKPVMLLDYDGTVLYSYTVSEFAALDAYPSNPTHTGLTAQGWNWTLSDAKAYVASYGSLVIGQMYTTTSGKTEIDITLTAPNLSPYLSLNYNGQVDINWGDGSAIYHMTLQGQNALQHEYAAAGNYTITLEVLSGNFEFNGVSNQNAGVLSYKSTNTKSALYSSCVTAVRLGPNANIGQAAFGNCYNLQYITIPSGVTQIGQYAFNYNYALSHITLPSTVTSIGTSAFYNCTELLSISMPKSIELLDTNTFYYCLKLKYLSLPSALTTIGDHAFYDCQALPDLVFPTSLTAISSSAFIGCANFINLTIPNNVESIDSSAFQGCARLSSVTLGSGVTTLASSVFQHCHALKSVTLPSTLTAIEMSALSSLFALQSITLPASLTSIGSSAFNNCQSLTEIHFLSTTPPAISNSNAFSNIPTNCIIYVPTGSLSAYTSATNYPSSSTYTYMEE